MSSIQLQHVLRRTHRRHRFVGFVADALLAAAVLIGSILVAVLVDAAVGLPPVGRIAVDLVLVSLWAGCVVYLMRRWAGQGFDARRVARLIEQRLGLRDSRLINAVELAADGDGGRADSPGLRRLATEEGKAAAEQVSPRRIVDRSRLRRSSRLAAAVAVAGLLLVLLVPGLFAAVAPRYLHPQADLPPFTLVQFDVEIQPDRIYRGRPATIRAHLGGPFAVEQANVVLVDGQVRQRLAMARTGAAADGTFELPLAEVAQPRRFYISTPYGRSRTFDLVPLPVPIFAAVTVRYDYPEYAGWQSSDRSLGDRGIRALVGTRLTLIVRSNMPLREGRLELATDQQAAAAGAEVSHSARVGAHDKATILLTPSGEDESVVSGSFPLTHSGRFTLSLIAADGTPSDEQIEGLLKAEPDRPPQIQLLSPDLRIEAPADWQLPVSVAASDDVGLERVTLHRTLNDEQPVQVDLPLERRGPTYADGSAAIDLAELQAQPGDVLRGFATAWDNHPSPSQSADSLTFEVHVLSREQYEQKARQQYRLEQILREMERLTQQMAERGAQRQQLVKQLEELQHKLTQDGRLSESDQQAVETARRRLAEYAEQSRRLAEQMAQRAEQDPLYEFEKPMQQTLSEQAQRVRQQAESAAAHHQRLAAASPEAIEAALEQLRQDDQQNDEAAQQRQYTQVELEKLQLADRMMLQAEWLMAIAGRQRGLADHLSSYRESQPSNAAEAARLMRLADQQQELRERLTATLADLEEAAAEASEALPKMAASAVGLVKQIHEMDVAGDQQQAEQHARRETGAAAWTRADRAAEKLESLISACQGLCNNSSGDLDGALGLSRSQLSQALQQLAQGRPGLPSGSGTGSGSGRGNGAGSSGQMGMAAPGAGPMTGGLNGNGPMLVGPHVPGLGGSQLGDLPVRTGSYGRVGRGELMRQGDPVETLDVDAHSAERATAPGPATVPVQYRDLAEQYFRRLAQDSR